MAHSQSIEVEHKFVIPSDIDERLQRAGARLLKERSFSDIYVDNECNELAFLDIWIRRRDGTLQMKSPVDQRTGSSILQYKETDDVNTINEHIKTALGNQDAESLIPFATFSTQRQTYILGDVHIDLDRTDFGYCKGESSVSLKSVNVVTRCKCTTPSLYQGIGEVELIVNHADEVIDAERRIKGVMDQLSIVEASGVEGKMQCFLSKHNKDLLDRLKDAMVL